jgi:phage-related protein
VAVVGEAHIIVKAITSGIGPEIKKAFDGINADIDKVGKDAGRKFNRSVSKGMGKNGNAFSSWFQKVKDGAEAARRSWAKLQKTGFYLQSSLGLLAGSIGSLIASLGSLIGSLGAAAPAMAAVGGAAVGMGIGIKLAGMALKGVTGPMSQVGKAAGGTKKTVKELREEMQQLRFDAEEAALSEKEAAMNLEKARNDLARVQDLPPNSMARREAELAYEQADLALRRAIDRNNDLQDEIKNGVKDTADASSGVDPYAGLTKSQKAFARLLVELKPKFDALKEAVAKGFLPALGNQIETLMTKNYPVLLRMFTGIGEALGDATNSVFGFINSSEGMVELETLFKNSEGVIRKLGEAFASVLDIVLTLLNAAGPITEEFVSWIADLADNFSKFLDKAAGDGSLVKFFDDSARVAKDFGDIFKNIFSGFGALIADSLQPGSGGDMLLQFLKDATAGFADMGGDKAGLRKFLQDSAANTISMLSAIGGILKVVMGMADNPGVKLFWDTVAKGTPLLEKILEDGAAAAPAMGELFLNVGRIVAAFSDSQTIKVFFDILSGAAGIVASIAESDFVKWLQSWYGPIHGAMLAFGTIAGIFTSVISVVVGSVMFVWKKLKFVWDIIKLIGLAIRIAFAANPLGLIITAIVAVIAALTWFFTQTEVGKQMWANFTKFLGDAWNAVVGFFMTIGQGFVDFFKGMWNGLTAFFKPVIDFYVAIFTTAFNIIKGILGVVGAIFTVIFVAIGWVVQRVWDGIVAGFNVVAGFLAPVVQGVSDFFTGVFTAIGDTVSGVWAWIQSGFQAFVDWISPVIKSISGVFSTVFNGIAGFFKGIINTLIGWAEGFVNFFIRGLNWIIGKINTIKLDIPPILQPLMGGAKSIGFNLPKVAELKLPRLAEGGVVMPSAGGTIAQIAEAGKPERVEPLDEDGLSKRDKVLIEALGGGSGVNITVNPSAGMDETALAALVSRRLAFELRKGAIA